MRAWLSILRERHPDVSWVPVAEGEAESDPVDDDQPATALSVAA